MKLGILDVGARIEDSFVLAPLADRLGYARYWITEFQPQPSPTLLAGLLAGQTERIRIGTAGVLLHYYPPLRTAHDFQLLARLFPDRIDAGFCGSMIADRAVTEADLDGRDLKAIIDAYPARAANFVHHLRNADPTSPLRWPGADGAPEIWSLGAGPRSIDLAALHGLSLGYALMYSSCVDDPALVQRYRERFVSHADVPSRVAVAICGICAPTDAEAQAMLAAYRGQFFMPRIVGSPETCARAFEELATRYGANDVIFADLCTGIEARTRCYELLAAVAVT